jgi:tetratricopeptide (TPR) repeat protein
VLNVAPMTVSPTLVKRFNRAAAFAREGNHEAAIAAYGNVLTQSLPKGEPYEASPDFVATIEMRRAWCFMDLERYAEAREVLEGARMIELLDALDAEDRYEYFFSYGNVLGNLGCTERMDEAMERALSAALELADEERFDRAAHWRDVWRAVRDATTHDLCST